MIEAALADKVVLVTGGTGSFGHHIVRRLLRSGAREIRVFSRDEKKQYHMANELGAGGRFPQYGAVRFMLGDIRDERSLRRAAAGAHIVFHAAALKHVLSCEYNVDEAIATNVLGTHNLISACIDAGTEVVMAISTDKAVAAVSAMGMTKALQEKMIVLANYRPPRGATRFACVRYGNVVGSRGSVVPLFSEQLQAARPLTITDPSMTRFMITLDKAVELVLTAAGTAVGGEIFVPLLPAAPIGTVARVMRRALRDQTAEEQIIGTRPGEKLHETLISGAEAPRTVVNGEVAIVLPEIDLPACRQQYGGYAPLDGGEYRSDRAPRLDDQAVAALLREAGWLPAGSI